MAYVKGNGGSVYRSYQSAFSVLNSQGSAITLPPVVDTQSVILKGYYVDGYLPTTQKGFEWKKSTDSSYVSVYVMDDISDTMTYNLSGLSSNTEYSYRAFIVNNATRYGEWEDFRTLGGIGLPDIETTKKGITLIPNPAKDYVYIETQGEKINNFSLYNINGQMVLKSEKLKTTSEKLNLSAFSKGVYIIKIITDKNVYSRKVVKQ